MTVGIAECPERITFVDAGANPLPKWVLKTLERALGLLLSKAEALVLSKADALVLSKAEALVVGRAFGLNACWP